MEAEFAVYEPLPPRGYEWADIGVLRQTENRAATRVFAGMRFPVRRDGVSQWVQLTKPKSALPGANAYSDLQTLLRRGFPFTCPWIPGCDFGLLHIGAMVSQLPCRDSGSRGDCDEPDLQTALRVFGMPTVEEKTAEEIQRPTEDEVCQAFLMPCRPRTAIQALPNTWESCECSADLARSGLPGVTHDAQPLLGLLARPDGDPSDCDEVFARDLNSVGATSAAAALAGLDALKGPRISSDDAQPPLHLIVQQSSDTNDGDENLASDFNRASSTPAAAALGGQRALQGPRISTDDAQPSLGLPVQPGCDPNRSDDNFAHDLNIASPTSAAAALGGRGAPKGPRISTDDAQPLPDLPVEPGGDPNDSNSASANHAAAHGGQVVPKGPRTSTDDAQTLFGFFTGSFVHWFLCCFKGPDPRTSDWPPEVPDTQKTQRAKNMLQSDSRKNQEALSPQEYGEGTRGPCPNTGQCLRRPPCSRLPAVCSAMDSMRGGHFEELEGGFAFDKEVCQGTVPPEVYRVCPGLFGELCVFGVECSEGRAPLRPCCVFHLQCQCHRRLVAPLRFSPAVPSRRPFEFGLAPEAACLGRESVVTWNHACTCDDKSVVACSGGDGDSSGVQPISVFLPLAQPFFERSLFVALTGSAPCSKPWISDVARALQLARGMNATDFVSKFLNSNPDAAPMLVSALFCATACSANHPHGVNVVSEPVCHCQDLKLSSTVDVLLSCLKGPLARLTEHRFDCRVAQTQESPQCLVSELQGQDISSCRHLHANFVLQWCIDLLEPHFDAVPVEVHVGDCRVLQRLIAHCSCRPLLFQLVDPMPGIFENVKKLLAKQADSTLCPKLLISDVACVAKLARSSWRSAEQCCDEVIFEPWAARFQVQSSRAQSSVVQQASRGAIQSCCSATRVLSASDVRCDSWQGFGVRDCLRGVFWFLAGSFWDPFLGCACSHDSHVGERSFADLVSCHDPTVGARIGEASHPGPFTDFQDDRSVSLRGPLLQ